MVLFAYQTVVDRSYQSVWSNMPDERVMIAEWSLPDVPLTREMTFTVSVDSFSSVNYIFARTNLGAAGYFVDDFTLIKNDTDSYKAVVVLKCTLDVWGTCMVFSSSYVKFNSGRVPNIEMLPTLHDVDYMFAGEETPPNLAGASGIYQPTAQLLTKSRVCFSVIGTVVNFGTSYYTVLSQEFSNYTEFQRIMIDIMTLSGFNVTVPNGGGGTEEKNIAVSTINGAWIVPSYKIELNTTVDTTEDAEKVYDMTATGYGEEYRGNTSFVILGNLLGANVANIIPHMAHGVTPRTSLTTYQYTGEPGYGYIGVGNATTFHVYPMGSFIDLSVKLSLATGASPCVVTMEINGNVVDLTSSLQINVSAYRDRVASSQQEQTYALNLISSTVGLGGAVVSGTGVATAALNAASAYAKFFSYRPAVTSSCGSSGVSTILNVNGFPVYLGTVGIFRMGIGSGTVYNNRRNHSGIQVCCSPDRMTYLTFHYQRTPVNYETNGFLQLDDPLIYPAGGSLFLSPYVGEVVDILKRGAFIFNPNTWA